MTTQLVWNTTGILLYTPNKRGDTTLEGPLPPKQTHSYSPIHKPCNKATMINPTVKWHRTLMPTRKTLNASIFLRPIPVPVHGYREPQRDYYRSKGEEEAMSVISYRVNNLFQLDPKTQTLENVHICKQEKKIQREYKQMQSEVTVIYRGTILTNDRNPVSVPTMRQEQQQSRWGNVRWNKENSNTICCAHPTFPAIQCPRWSKTPNLFIPKPASLPCFFIRNAFHQAWILTTDTE